MIYGYARVSTHGQEKSGNSLERQRQMLTGAGCEKIFKDVYTGAKADRPSLTEMMNIVKEGDTVVVSKLDRIRRNVADGINIIETLAEKGVTVRVLNMGTFDNTATGRLCRNIMLSFAEFERDLIKQRTADGKAIAKQREDYREGRPRIEVSGVEEMKEKVAQGLLNVTQACKQLGISRSKWYRI